MEKQIIEWICKSHDCGLIVEEEDKPEPIIWTNGHICNFELLKKEQILVSNGEELFA